MQPQQHVGPHDDQDQAGIIRRALALAGDGDHGDDAEPRAQRDRSEHRLHEALEEAVIREGEGGEEQRALDPEPDRPGDAHRRRHDPQIENSEERVQHDREPERDADDEDRVTKEVGAKRILFVGGEACP